MFVIEEENRLLNLLVSQLKFMARWSRKKFREEDVKEIV